MIKPFELLDVTGFESLALTVDGIDKRCPGKRFGNECSPPLSQINLPMLDQSAPNALDFFKIFDAKKFSRW